MCGGGVWGVFVSFVCLFFLEIMQLLYTIYVKNLIIKLTLFV